MHDENSIFDVDLASYPISLMLRDCITYDINMTLLWLKDVTKMLLLLFFFLRLLKYGHPLVFFKY